MSVNALIAQGVRPIGADLPEIGNMLHQRRAQDAETARRNELMDIARRREEAATQQQLADEERAFLGNAVEILSASAADPQRFAATRQQFLADPRTMGVLSKLSVTPDQVTPENVLQVADQIRMAQGIAAPDSKAADNYRVVGNTLLRLGPGSVEEVYKAPHAPPMQISVQNNKEAEGVGKWFADQYGQIVGAGYASQGKLARLDRLSALLEGVETGKLTPTATEIAGYARAFGIDVDPKLDAKQAILALSNEMALQMRNPSGGAGMPGAMSDKDREFLMSIVPSLANTPQGNRLIIETARNLAQRDRDIANMARAYRQKHGGIDEGFFDEVERFANQNPLFDTGQAGAPSLAPGTVQDGYRFKGGNPADPNSWERLNQ